MKNQLAGSVAERIGAILSGMALGAFREFFAPNMDMQENESESTFGMTANLLRQHELFRNITASTERKLSLCLWQRTEVWWSRSCTTNTNSGRSRKFHQVPVQQWQGRQFIHEKFHYGS